MNPVLLADGLLTNQSVFENGLNCTVRHALGNPEAPAPAIVGNAVVTILPPDAVIPHISIDPSGRMLYPDVPDMEDPGLTKAVVAMEVSESPDAGVGAVGVPVNAGDTKGANDALTL